MATEKTTKEAKKVDVDAIIQHLEEATKGLEMLVETTASLPMKNQFKGWKGSVDRIRRDLGTTSHEAA